MNPDVFREKNNHTKTLDSILLGYSSTQVSHCIHCMCVMHQVVLQELRKPPEKIQTEVLVLVELTFHWEKRVMS